MVFVITQTHKSEYNDEHECDIVSMVAVRSTKELADEYINDVMDLYDSLAKDLLNGDPGFRKRQLDSYNIEEVSDFK